MAALNDLALQYGAEAFFRIAVPLDGDPELHASSPTLWTLLALDPNAPAAAREVLTRLLPAPLRDRALHAWRDGPLGDRSVLPAADTQPSRWHRELPISAPGQAGRARDTNAAAATTPRWVVTDGTVSYGPNGALVEGVVRDVTSEHRLRSALQRVEDRGRRLWATGNDVAFSIDRTQTPPLRWVSANAARTLGVSAKTLLDAPDGLLSRIHPSDRDDAEAALVGTEAARRELRWTLRPGTDDSWVWVELTVLPEQRTGGAAGTGVADGRLRRIDSAKQVQRLARDAVRREREAAEAQEELTALREHITRAVSHRVRTPLAVLRAAAETGAATGSRLDPEQLTRLFEQAGRAAQQLEHLLEDLLDLRGPDSDGDQATAPVDLVAAAQEATHATLRPDRPVTWDTATEVWCLTNGPTLERVLEHLLDNVERHTPPGAPVAIRIRGDVDQVVVEITDTGPGLPNRLAEHVFEPLTSSIDEPGSANPGLGIGLTVAERLVRQLGGELTLWSAATAGTTAAVALPIWPNAQQAD